MRNALRHSPIGPVTLGIGACAVALLLAGCGSDQTPSGSAQRSPSASAAVASGSAASHARSPAPPRASRPPALPTKPTDQVGTGTVTGTAMSTATGPCLVIVTDDGERYALFNPHKILVSRADRVRATIGPPPKKQTCTGGHQATATTITKIG